MHSCKKLHGLVIHQKQKQNKKTTKKKTYLKHKDNQQLVLTVHFKWSHTTVQKFGCFLVRKFIFLFSKDAFKLIRSDSKYL